MSDSKFDPTKPLVMAKFGTLNGHDLNGGARVVIVEGEPVAPGEVTEAVAGRLWSAQRLIYRDQARPTPVESVAEAAERLTEVDDLGNNWFMVRAPWITPAKAHGRAALQDLRAEVVAHGIEFGVEPLPVGEPVVEAPAQPTAVVPDDATGADALGG